MLTQDQLAAWVEQAKEQAQVGQLPDYVPLLAQADSSWAAIQVQTVMGQCWAAGDTHQSFVLMSTIKPFLLLFLLETLGISAVFRRVGTDPSSRPFHSLVQLAEDGGFPRNPMINSGAIALSGCLPGTAGVDRCENFRKWLNAQSGANLVLDADMLQSVRSLPNETNRALIHHLVQARQLQEAECTLDTYNHICCLSSTVDDLARLGMLLASPHPALTPQHQQIVNAVMLTCGLYEASGRFAVQIGVPIKSGVSGAMLAVVPGDSAIACYSPPLDESGNSIAGLMLIQQLVQTLNLSLFSVNRRLGK
jgi:glutaminase